MVRAGSAPRAFRSGPTLPLQAGPQFHRKSKDGSLFHAAIADTEPDGWARRVIMRDHIKRRQELRRQGKEEAQPLNALDYLLAVDDFSRVGALRFRDEEGVFQRAREEGPDRAATHRAWTFAQRVTCFRGE